MNVYLKDFEKKNTFLFLLNNIYFVIHALLTKYDQCCSHDQLTPTTVTGVLVIFFVPGWSYV